MKLSVIIPCLNAEQLLPRQLDALARQDCPAPWEVVVVDNGSDDRTAEIARSFRDRLPHLRVVSAARRGRHHACNAGARAARAPYLVFVDADDEVGHGFLNAMLCGLETHDLVGSRLDQGRLNPALFRNVGDVQSVGLTRGPGGRPFVMGAGMGMSRALFDRLEGFRDRPYCEDIDFSWRAIRAGTLPVFLPGAVVHYRQRSTARLMFQQHRRFGAAHVLLYREYRTFGMARRPASVVLRDWLAIARSFAVLWRSAPDARLRWVRRFARAIGRLSGSVRYGVFYP